MADAVLVTEAGIARLEATVDAARAAGALEARKVASLEEENARMRMEMDQSDDKLSLAHINRSHLSSSL